MTRRSNWSRARRVVAAAVVVVSAVAALPPWRVVAQEKPAEKPAGEASKESIKPGTADPLVEKLRARREAEAAAPPGGPAPGQPANGGRGQRSSFNGNVVAETLDLRAPGDGVVVRLGVRSGERVKQGALIVEFDAQRAKAGLAQAEAKLALAESQLKRVRLMVEAQHAAAASEVEEKQANLQMAKAEIDLRRQDLQETQIRAPFDGAVELTAREGLRVTKGEALGRVIAVDAPRVAFVAPVAAIRELTVGRPVEVGLTAYPDRTFKAEISDVSPIVDPASGTLSVYARITEKAAGVLPGMYARVTLRGPDAPPSAPQQ